MWYRLKFVLLQLSFLVRKVFTTDKVHFLFVCLTVNVCIICVFSISAADTIKPPTSEPFKKPPTRNGSRMRTPLKTSMPTSNGVKADQPVTLRYTNSAKGKRESDNQTQEPVVEPSYQIASPNTFWKIVKFRKRQFTWNITKSCWYWSESFGCLTQCSVNQRTAVLSLTVLLQKYFVWILNIPGFYASTDLWSAPNQY